MKDEKYYLLDFDGLSDKKELYCYIGNKLGFPDYFGRNLDALYDCLTETPGCVILRHVGALSALGSYGESVIETFRRAENDTPYLSLIVLENDQ